MICQRCGARPANVHVTQITEERKVIRHLCNVCAQEIGMGDTGSEASGKDDEIYSI